MARRIAPSLSSGSLVSAVLLSEMKHWAIYSFIHTKIQMLIFEGWSSVSNFFLFLLAISTCQRGKVH